MPTADEVIYGQERAAQTTRQDADGNRRAGRQAQALQQAVQALPGEEAEGWRVSWAQLGSIAKEARETAEAQKREPPLACPRDGEPLDYHPGKGVLHCKFCGFQTVGRPSG